MCAVKGRRSYVWRVTAFVLTKPRSSGCLYLAEVFIAFILVAFRFVLLNTWAFMNK